jgi:tetratricopeptide (TPR) repeat protein
MSPSPTDGKPLTLQLVDDAPASRAPDAPAATENVKPGRDLRITTDDEFLAAAAKEYEKGQVDQALWARSAAQGAGDESLAIAAYLRARATALRLARREQQQRDNAARATGPGTEAGTTPRAKIEAPAREPARPTKRRLDPKLLYGGAAAAGLAVVLVAWLMLSSEPADAPATVAAASSSSAPAPKRVAAQPKRAVAEPAPEPSLEARVAELERAGNWNVLVLYAVEWTRKEPSNASAWNALSTGYSNLRQHAEALDAATRAVSLAPGDATFLRTLGHANLALERFPEAGAAFDGALAVAADDVEALCGAAEVAQKEGRPRDADAFAERISAAKGRCRVAPDRPAFAPAAVTRKAAR